MESRSRIMLLSGIGILLIIVHTLFAIHLMLLVWVDKDFMIRFFLPADRIQRNLCLLAQIHFYLLIINVLGEILMLLSCLKRNLKKGLLFLVIALNVVFFIISLSSMISFRTGLPVAPDNGFFDYFKNNSFFAYSIFSVTSTAVIVICYLIDKRECPPGDGLHIEKKSLSLSSDTRK